MLPGPLRDQAQLLDPQGHRLQRDEVEVLHPAEVGHLKVAGRRHDLVELLPDRRGGHQEAQGERLGEPLVGRLAAGIVR